MKTRTIQLVFNKNSKWEKETRSYMENKEWRKYSIKFAVAVLRTLRLDGKNQSWLSEKLDTTPQYISKIVSGKENLSLKTMIRIQTILGKELLSIKNVVAIIEPKDVVIVFINLEKINAFHNYSIPRNDVERKNMTGNNDQYSTVYSSIEGREF